MSGGELCYVRLRVYLWIRKASQAVKPIIRILPCQHCQPCYWTLDRLRKHINDTEPPNASLPSCTTLELSMAPVDSSIPYTTEVQKFSPRPVLVSWEADQPKDSYCKKQRLVSRSRKTRSMPWARKENASYPLIALFGL